MQNAQPDSLPSKSPLGAVLRSAVIPGWGQFYNESYWKIPVVWGFLGYLGYIWVDNHNNYWDASENYRYYAALAVTDPQYNDYRDFYKRNRDFYRDQRDLFAIYIGITYVLTLLDAYVDAHLFNFNVDEDVITRTPRLQMQFRFNSIFR